MFSLGGFLELLRDEELDEETRREFLATMSEQVDRLAKLATELLDLSRADAGRLRVERESVDLDEVAETVGGRVRGARVARAAAARLEVDDGALGARRRAARAPDRARAGRERARAHAAGDAASSVRAADGALEVEDDGPGIPPEHAAHVFERFYRVEGERASGSGLGLAIARELAQAMGGSLELESDAGRDGVQAAAAGSALARSSPQRV